MVSSPSINVYNNANKVYNLFKLYLKRGVGLSRRMVAQNRKIAAITKHEGFKWVKRKHYYNRAINPE
jgi:hypothetical protein